MITEKCRGAISNREIESHIRREQPTITPHKRYSRIGLKYGFLILPNMGYYFTNILEITTSSLSLDYINPKNKKRLDLIMKLHKMGKSNKEIVEKRKFIRKNPLTKRRVSQQEMKLHMEFISEMKKNLWY